MNPLDMIVAEVDKLVGQFVAPFLAGFGIPQNLVTPLVVGLVTTALTIYLFSSISKSGGNGKAAPKKTRSSSRFVDSISLPRSLHFSLSRPFHSLPPSFPLTVTYSTVKSRRSTKPTAKVAEAAAEVVAEPVKLFVDAVLREDRERRPGGGGRDRIAAKRGSNPDVIAAAHPVLAH